MVLWLKDVWVLAPQAWTKLLTPYPSSSKCLMAWHWQAIKTSLGTMTPFFSLIDMIWNCLAATDMMSWLKDVWVLAQAWGQRVPNFWHHNTDVPSKPHWTPWHKSLVHEHNIKMFGSNRYGIMAKRCLSVGSSIAWGQRTKLLTPYPSSSKCLMAWHSQAIKTSLGTMTPFFSLIDMIWNCLAATDMVSWLKDVWVLAQAWGQGVPNFWHHTTDVPSKPHWTPWHKSLVP
jgi:hypothetical protein